MVPGSGLRVPTSRFPFPPSGFILPSLEFLIDSFILYLATERGLSESYQLSVRRTLETLQAWAEEQGHREWRDLGVDDLSAYLARCRC